MQEHLPGPREAEKKTVLFVTHDIDEAVIMGNRVVVMSARPGRIKLDRAVRPPHPRHYSIMTTPEFMALEAELTEQVRLEVRGAGSDGGGGLTDHGIGLAKPGCVYTSVGTDRCAVIRAEAFSECASAPSASRTCCARALRSCSTR